MAQRTSPFLLRFTPAERERLDQEAAALGQTLSHLMRDRILNPGGHQPVFPLQPPPPPIESAPQKPVRQPRPPRQALTVPPLLPTFLEPHREALQRWLDVRLRKHPAKREAFTSLDLRAIELAAAIGGADLVALHLQDAIEGAWRSLGFSGYAEHLRRRHQDHGVQTGRIPINGNGKPPQLSFKQRQAEIDAQVTAEAEAQGLEGFDAILFLQQRSLELARGIDPEPQTTNTPMVTLREEADGSFR